MKPFYTSGTKVNVSESLTSLGFRCVYFNLQFLPCRSCEIPSKSDGSGVCPLQKILWNKFLASYYTVDGIYQPRPRTWWTDQHCRKRRPQSEWQKWSVISALMRSVSDYQLHPLPPSQNPFPCSRTPLHRLINMALMSLRSAVRPHMPSWQTPTNLQWFKCLGIPCDYQSGELMSLLELWLGMWTRSFLKTAVKTKMEITTSFIYVGGFVFVKPAN